MKKIFIITIILLNVKVHAQQPASPVLGQIDFYDLIKAIPHIEKTPEAAFDYACNKSLVCDENSRLNTQYEYFTRKETANRAKLTSAFAAKARTNGTMGKNANQNDLANQNVLIQQMGGLEKITQMSENDRKEAAKNAVTYQASSSALSHFSQAEMLRMANDPSYARNMAAKYNNMTEEEKAKMVRTQMAKSGGNKINEEINAKSAANNAMKNTMDIDNFVATATAELQQAMTAYAHKTGTLRTGPGNHEEIDKMYDQEYRKIPLIKTIDGVYKNPETVKRLQLKYAQKHKERATIELTAIQTEKEKTVAAIKKVIADYHAFLDVNGYKVNGKMTDILNGTNTEISLMQLEMSIEGSIHEMAESSYKENSLASDRERNYQQLLSEHS
jgi:hypothetical protein